MTSSPTTIDVEFCGERFPVSREQPFTVGRDGDLVIDENPYLHRHFLTVSVDGDLCWLANVGSRLTATVSDTGGSFQGWLAPGARLPIVFEQTSVLFTAGPTTYELFLLNTAPAFVATERQLTVSGDTTIGPVGLTLTQRLLIVALAEPMLRRDGASFSELPSSRAAAQRLGWELTRFNRKLDNVCDKLDRHGIRGLRGGVGQLAINRRARLVEHAVSSRLVTADDLRLLDTYLHDPSAHEPVAAAARTLASPHASQENSP